MEIYGLPINEKANLKFEIPEKPLTTEKLVVDNLGKEKIEALKKSIKDLNELVKERELLSKKFLQESENIKTEINNFLIENENIKGFEKSDLIREKNLMRNKKIEISELQLKEKIDCWKDISLLKKELRENEQELSEKESRLIELNRLLGEN